MSTIFSQAAADTLEDGHPFCLPRRTGGGMIMYMDGFRRTWDGGNVCLNLFFPGWTLDSREKFIMAACGVFTMAVAVEGISKLRRRLVLLAKYEAESGDTNNPPNARTLMRSRRLKISPNALCIMVTMIHGAQAFMGYLLMLATMTFSVELFFSVVLGLATGYAIFFRFQDALTDNHHVTSNPCCNFLEGEAQADEDDDDQGNTVTTGDAAESAVVLDTSTSDRLAETSGNESENLL